MGKMLQGEGSFDMLNGECIEAEETECTGCGTPLKLEVCQSRAGYYIGFQCPNCGPYSRESGYYKNQDAAEMSLMTGGWHHRNGERWKWNV